tara:strand:+ start:1282 stop:2337 length:1056 start_codon:yes stop_codon:yes gene_type:complete
MKILKQVKNAFKLEITNQDDLWYLSHIIDPGDLIKGKTFRKIKIGGENERSRKVVKKAIFIEIKVEKIGFSKTNGTLRVGGGITQGPDDISKGSFHTFTFDEGISFTLTKETWLRFQKDKLDEAASDKVGNILILVFDREEALFAILKKYGFKVIGELKGKVTKKADLEKVEGNFYKEIVDTLSEYIKRYKSDHAIVASPSFWKEYLMKEVDEDLRKKIILASCSSVGKGAINEVLKRDEVKQALHEERAAQEIKFVESLLAEIGKGEKATYGKKHVLVAGQTGAVKNLLVTDSFLFKERENEKYEEIDEMMKIVDKMKGTIHIISSEHDGGKKLDGLGGIGAILRYALQL